MAASHRQPVRLQTIVNEFGGHRFGCKRTDVERLCTAAFREAPQANRLKGLSRFLSGEIHPGRFEVYSGDMRWLRNHERPDQMVKILGSKRSRPVVDVVQTFQRWHGVNRSKSGSLVRELDRPGESFKCFNSSREFGFIGLPCPSIMGKLNSGISTNSGRQAFVPASRLREAVELNGMVSIEKYLSKR